MIRLLLIGFAISFASSLLLAQFDIRGEATAEFFKSGDGESQYTIDNGRPTFGWRLDVFADALVSDNIAFLSNVRMLQDQILHVDLLAIRVTDVWSSGISLEAGQIDLPFGNLGSQRFPRQNPFFDLPLLNEHVTALCESNYNLWTYSPAYAMRGDGVRLLDQGLYDLGLKAFGGVGILDYGVAVTNGMVSATGTYSPSGLNPNHGIGTIARLGVTPFMGFRIGVSYAFGPFMKDVSDSSRSQLYERSPDNYTQHAAAADIDYSFGHFVMSGEILANRWQYVQGVKLDALGFSAMAEYEFSPRITGAIRAGGIRFSNVTLLEFIPEDDYGYTGPVGFVRYSGAWDHNVLRLEGAVTYKIDERLLFKFGYQANRTYNLPHDPFDDVFFTETVLSF